MEILEPRNRIMADCLSTTPPIKKLSDPIHYVQNYNGELLKLVQLAKSKSGTCKADAMRLSRYLAYSMITQHTPGVGKENCTLKNLRRQARQVLSIIGTTTSTVATGVKRRHGQKRKRLRKRESSETRKGIQRSTYSRKRLRTSTFQETG